MKGFLSACLILGFGLLELGILAVIGLYCAWYDGKNPYLVIGICLFVISDHFFNVYLADKGSRIMEKWLKKNELKKKEVNYNA